MPKRKDVMHSVRNWKYMETSGMAFTLLMTPKYVIVSLKITSVLGLNKLSR